MNKSKAIGTAIVILLLVGAAFWLARNQKNAPTPPVGQNQNGTSTPTSTPQATTTPQQATEVPSISYPRWSASVHPSRPGWSIYTDESLGLRFDFPSSWKVMHDAFGVHFRSDRVQQLLDQKKLLVPYDDQLTVIRYDSMSELVSSKPASLKELFADESSKELWLFQRERQFGNLNFFEVMTTGYGTNIAYLLEAKSSIAGGPVYEFSFETSELEEFKATAEEIQGVLSSVGFLADLPPASNAVVSPDGRIFYGGFERGKVEGEWLTVKLTPTTSLSFKGDVHKLSFDAFLQGLAKPGQMVPFFEYDGLWFSTHLARPNSSAQTNEVDWSCRTPLIGDAPFYYCKSIGSHIGMYQLTDFDAVGFGTGGGTAFAWQRIYAIRPGKEDLFAIGDLEVAFGSDDYANFEMYKRGESYGDEDSDKRVAESYQKVVKESKKERLDELVRRPELLERLMSWDSAIASLKVE